MYTCMCYELCVKYYIFSRSISCYPMLYFLCLSFRFDTIYKINIYNVYAILSCVGLLNKILYIIFLFVIIQCLDNFELV